MIYCFVNILNTSTTYNQSYNVALSVSRQSRNEISFPEFGDRIKRIESILAYGELTTRRRSRGTSDMDLLQRKFPSEGPT